MAVQSDDITLQSVITGQILDGGGSLMDAHLPLEIQQLPAARGARTAKRNSLRKHNKARCPCADPAHCHSRILRPGWFYGTESSRPTFSSRFAVAKSSACGCEESLFLFLTLCREDPCHIIVCRHDFSAPAASLRSALCTRCLCGEPFFPARAPANATALFALERPWTRRARNGSE